jgi:phage major head subunit gpT-like protein
VAAPSPNIEQEPMEITTANLTALFTGFDVIFQRGFEKPPSYYEKIATVVRSASR